MRTNRLSALPLLAACAFACTLASSANATTPDDICPPDADPCVVAGRVVVDEGADLDFGLRTVRLAPGSKLVVSGFFSTIECGGLVVERGAAFDMGGKKDGGSGPYIDVVVKGRCLDAPTVGCLRDSDCSGGECTGGDFTMMGRVNGRSHGLTRLDLEAAGNIVVDGRLNFSSRSVYDGVGGDLILDANGSLEFRGSFSARGRGYDGGGGFLELSATGDARVIDAQIDLRGQDYDGGLFLLEGGGDAYFSGELDASSRAGGGYGGYFDISADQDVIVAPQSDGSPTTIVLRGHRASSGFSAGFAGEGGEFYAYAERHVFVNDGVEIDLQGAPTSVGGTVILNGFENVVLDGDIDVSTSGAQSESGQIELVSGGSTTIGLQALLRLDAVFGGSLEVEADGPVFMDGTITSTSTGTHPADIDIESLDDVTISGDFHVYAEPVLFQPNTSIDVYGCDVSFVGGGSALLDSNGWGISVTAREALLVDAASSLVASGSVSFIELTHRDPLQEPTLLGTVTPTPDIVLNTSLAACP